MSSDFKNIMHKSPDTQILLLNANCKLSYKARTDPIRIFVCQYAPTSQYAKLGQQKQYDLAKIFTYFSFFAIFHLFFTGFGQIYNMW